MLGEELPFTDRAARYLMLVGKHPVISNRKHVSDLPSSWGTRAVLALSPLPGRGKRRNALARGLYLPFWLGSDSETTG